MHWIALVVAIILFAWAMTVSSALLMLVLIGGALVLALLWVAGQYRRHHVRQSHQLAAQLRRYAPPTPHLTTPHQRPTDVLTQRPENDENTPSD